MTSVKINRKINEKMERRIYSKPQIVVTAVELSYGVMKENSWSPDGGSTNIGIIDGNPDTPKPGDDYGDEHPNEAKGNKYNMWE
jgi:hypothetical protein